MAKVQAPTLSSETDWRIPRPSDRFQKVVPTVPKNGDWYVVISGQGLTVSEQQARTLNSGSTEWEWGYRVYAKDGVLVSDLAVRWMGSRK